MGSAPASAPSRRVKRSPEPARAISSSSPSRKAGSCIRPIGRSRGPVRHSGHTARTPCARSAGSGLRAARSSCIPGQGHDGSRDLRASSASKQGSAQGSDPGPVRDPARLRRRLDGRSGSGRPARIALSRLRADRGGRQLARRERIHRRALAAGRARPQRMERGSHFRAQPRRHSGPRSCSLLHRRRRRGGTGHARAGRGQVRGSRRRVRRWPVRAGAAPRQRGDGLQERVDRTTRTRSRRT